jgi:multicomponent Na+:H+ antiporter subunit B
VTLPVRLVARLLLAPLLVLSLALLVKGYTSVGDGFTAGILAALGVTMQSVAGGPARVELLPLRWAYRLAFVGLLLSLALMIVPLAEGEALFTHSPPPGSEAVKLGTLELITPVLFDAGVFLLVLGTVVASVQLIARTDREDAPGKETP